KNHRTSQKPSVSIDDVARKAEVSTATVSRVLANKPHVRPEMRQRVWDAVHELNYRPNRVAQSLRSQKSKTIGVIIPDIENPFFTSVVRAIEDVAQGDSYGVFLCNSDEDWKKEQQYINLLRDENVAGIIIAPTGRRNQKIYREMVSELPTVALDRHMSDVDTDIVRGENIESAYQLVAELIADGHTRIGLVSGLPDVTTSKERKEGYLRALRDHDIAADAALIVETRPKENDGFVATSAMLALPERPTAIFAINNLLMVGAFKAIRKQGLLIPDDVALVTFDLMSLNPLIDLPIITIEQPTYELGRRAAEMLLARIGDPEQPTQREILKGRMVDMRQREGIL
ncbi:MAG: LacI family transcriptional regulator, partial [Chloroflexi bacterium]